MHHGSIHRRRRFSLLIIKQAARNHVEHDKSCNSKAPRRRRDQVSLLSCRFSLFFFATILNDPACHVTCLYDDSRAVSAIPYHGVLSRTGPHKNGGPSNMLALATPHMTTLVVVTVKGCLTQSAMATKVSRRYRSGNRRLSQRWVSICTNININPWFHLCSI